MELVLVKTADGTSQIVRKGEVKEALGNGISVIAYDATEFSSYILAAHILSENIEV